MDVKLFNALYGCYFSTVYHILKEAGNREFTNTEYWNLIKKMSEEFRVYNEFLQRQCDVLDQYKGNHLNI